MLTIRRWFCIVSAVAISLSGGACQTPAVVPAPPAPGSEATTPPAAPATSAVRREIGFRSPRRLAEHYQKHGREFEGYSQADYLRAAQDIRDAPVGGDILELSRPDGTMSRFDRRSGAFVAYDADGTIRTFFKPNDGEAYFRRQARRSPQ